MYIYVLIVFRSFTSEKVGHVNCILLEMRIICF